MKICEVTGFAKENGQIKGVKIGSGETLAADRVVLTLGPWSSKKPAQSLKIPSVRPHKAASIIMEQVDTSAHALFLSYTHQSGRREETEVEFYPRPDGTLYVCGSETQAPLPDHTSQVPLECQIYFISSVDVKCHKILKLKCIYKPDTCKYVGYCTYQAIFRRQQFQMI